MLIDRKQMPKNFSFLLFILAFVVLFDAGCKQKPKIGNKFYEHYKNKAYLDFDTAAYYNEFKHQLFALNSHQRYSSAIQAYYSKHSYEPHFVNQFLFNGQLRTLIKYLRGATEHGLNADQFRAGDIERELDTIEANHVSNIANFYPVVAKLELESATSLLKYASIIKYGVVNPRRLYRRYNMEIKRPDSLFFEKIYQTEDLAVYLEDIQPKSDAYLILKKELAAINTDVVDSAKLFRLRTIKLNMERLRWQTPVKETRYLWVNIPAFNLQWVENKKPVFDMKVCVGEPKPAGYDTSLNRFLKTGSLDDKPMNHETTILSSHINTIELNPTWSIPTSIAQSEIYYAIQRNPAYLANNNIRVYYKGKEVEDPDTITWKHLQRQKMPYSFKQDASELNALGKFKFIFDNSSSIYLHDTPNKKAFKKPWRAVSHGCVRVDDPLKLTQALVNDTNEVDNIRMAVGLAPVNPKDTIRYKAILAKREAEGSGLKTKYLGLKPDMQLFIDYYTCWPDENGKLVFYYDAYRMDAVLYKAMEKYLSK
jgi:murein L,D-transpeptidase YcbB/YkuD